MHDYEETPSKTACYSARGETSGLAKVTSQNEEQHTTATGETRIGASEEDNILDILGSPPKKKERFDNIQTHFLRREKPDNVLCRYEYFADNADFRQESD